MANDHKPACHPSSVQDVHDYQLRQMTEAIKRMEAKLDEIGSRLARGDTTLALHESRLNGHEVRLSALEGNDNEAARKPGFFQEFILPHLVPVVLQLLITAVTVLIVLAASHGLMGKP